LLFRENVTYEGESDIEQERVGEVGDIKPGRGWRSLAEPHRRHR